VAALVERCSPTCGAPIPLIERPVIERISSLGYVGGTPEHAGAATHEQVDPKDRISTFNRITRLQWENGRRLNDPQVLCGNVARP
jgi:hypothetical protein